MFAGVPGLWDFVETPPKIRRRIGKGGNLPNSPPSNPKVSPAPQKRRDVYKKTYAINRVFIWIFVTSRSQP